ncbi:hypothetical protein BDV25DRAFT_30620 [Aspergillus avenaceus]|uniref:Secreted protein n=1 Tax=Aspergillus avenaceus TaxID=36643 RepID=A0A5N6TMR2_ASPAV|nr:hypothetical protein BDV25DRAFT_30620 [Aspergillus avenaceus]
MTGHLSIVRTYLFLLGRSLAFPRTNKTRFLVRLAPGLFEGRVRNFNRLALVSFRAKSQPSYLHRGWIYKSPPACVGEIRRKEKAKEQGRTTTPLVIPVIIVVLLEANRSLCT